MRLVIVGDTDACEVLAELAAHLGFDAVTRTDEAPAGLGADDVVVVATRDPLASLRVVDRILASGAPAWIGIDVDQPRSDAFARRLVEKHGDAGARVVVPAALPVGAQTPGQRAIAIGAMLINVARRAN